MKRQLNYFVFLVAIAIHSTGILASHICCRPLGRFTCFPFVYSQHGPLYPLHLKLIAKNPFVITGNRLCSAPDNTTHYLPLILLACHGDCNGSDSKIKLSSVVSLLALNIAKRSVVASRDWFGMKNPTVAVLFLRTSFVHGYK